MEQVLWVPGMNYSKHWKRWNMIRPRASCKKMEHIGFYGITTHLVPLIWEGSGNIKFDLQELFWKDCWRSTVILWMMNHSEHWWLKLSLSLTWDHSPWRPSVNQKVKYHQVTSLQSKQVLSCLHQVNFANQMHTQKGDGNVYNILQDNFGADGERSFSRVYKQVRQIWKKRIWNFAVGDIVLLRHDCHQNQWPMARIVSIDTDAKNDVVSVTLWVADKKGGPSQILKWPITKLVLLVENEFNSPSDGAITKLTKWELFCGESDIVVWYGLKDTHREKAP